MCHTLGPDTPSEKSSPGNVYLRAFEQKCDFSKVKSGAANDQLKNCL